MARKSKKKPVTKKKHNWLQRLLSAFIILALAGMISVLSINYFVQAQAKDQILTPAQVSGMAADCVLVLGAGVYGDGKPSPLLEARILQGVELYDLDASEKILMSGDHGRKDYDEVNAMKRTAIDKGVPSSDIFMDHAGFSTYESLFRAREIFEAKKIIIVTQRYHLYRALFIAEKLGFEAYGVPSDPQVFGGQVYRDLREILARNKDFLYVIVKPEPTYLGEKIPISGDGDLTNDK